MVGWLLHQSLLAESAGGQHGKDDPLPLCGRYKVKLKQERPAACKCKRAKQQQHGDLDMSSSPGSSQQT